MGAVPPGSIMEVATMKKCTRQNTVMMLRLPNSFLVMPALGRRIKNSQNGWGRNVATLKAVFMESAEDPMASADRSDE